MRGERTLQSILLPPYKRLLNFTTSVLKPEIKCMRRIHLEIPLNHFFTAYNIVNTHVRSGEGLEGNRRTIRASLPNLKLDDIVKKRKKKKLSEK